jgi:hypothetical protein
MVSRFDIFSGTHQGNRAIWLDGVNDFEEAKQKMLSIATEKPGKYFVFSAQENRIVAEIEMKPSVYKEMPADAAGIWFCSEQELK